MMRFTLCALLLLTSCRRERADPRVVEVTSPAHVVVRVIDVPQKVDCASYNDWKDQLGCRVKRAPRIGCTYVEVGAEADVPLMRTATADTSACSDLGEQRVRVLDAPNKKVDLQFDDAGTRAAVLLNNTVWILYLHEGQLLEARHQGLAPERQINNRFDTREEGMHFTGYLNASFDGGVDWSMIPSRLEVLPTYVNRFSDADIDTEFRVTPDAQRAFTHGLTVALTSKRRTPRDSEWSRLVRRLDDAGHQHVREAMLELLSDGDEDALAWVEADETIPREQLIAALEDGTSHMNQVSPLMVDALFRLKPESAAPLACRQLEDAEFDNEYYSDDFSDLATPLGLIAKYKVKCPWVVPMLMRTQCSYSLRHLAEGSEDPEDDGLPLASAEEQARALKLLFTDPADYSELDEQFFAEGVHASWLLLAAAQVQGPLPDEFVKRNARRTYKRVSTFKGSSFDDPCSQQETPNWACRVPLSVNTITRFDCVVDIDDANKRLTLSPAPGWKTQAD